MVDVREVYRKEVERLTKVTFLCPFDRLSCCSICKDCGRRFCECGHPNACERMLGRGCSGTRGEGCPKGWHADV